ncbi:hypothetical protein, partial [Klebsiella aerogenes]
ENILLKAREYVGDAPVGTIPDDAITILSDDLATPSLINWLASIRKSGSVSPADYHAAFALLGVDVAGQTAAS